MIIVRNNYIPFSGYKCINLFGILFIKGNAIIDGNTIRHEEIHSCQMKELLWIGFYVWYILEWIIRLIQTKDLTEAYRKISFEQEAYHNEKNSHYQDLRSRYTWLSYL